MYVSRTVVIEHKVGTLEELDSFNEYIMGLVLTIDHTPYNVSVEQTSNVDEEKALS